jgi:hypothetical protein
MASKAAAQTGAEVDTISEPGSEPGPVLLWEGQAAMFASPDGGRVIRYQEDGEEKFVALPAELVPGLELLRVNPGALMAIAQGPMGGLARRLVGQVTRKAAPDAG